MNALLGLQNPGNIGQRFQQGYEIAKERKREEQYTNALTAYARDPNSDEAFEGIVQADPRLGIQIGQQRAAQQAQAQEADIKRRAASGDPAAVAELAGVDWNAWKGLTAQDKDAIKRKTDYLGNAALAISQLPAEQQAHAWDGYVQHGVQMGYSDLAQYQGQFSPQALSSLVANAGKVKTLFDMEQPKYQVIPEGGTLVNTRDPQALSDVNKQNSASYAVPDAAAEHLRKNPSLKAQFDQKYGQGAADSILGGAGSNASSGF